MGRPITLQSILVAAPSVHTMLSGFDINRGKKKRSISNCSISSKRFEGDADLRAIGDADRLEAGDLTLPRGEGADSPGRPRPGGAFAGGATSFGLAFCSLYRLYWSSVTNTVDPLMNPNWLVADTVYSPTSSTNIILMIKLCNCFDASYSSFNR